METLHAVLQLCYRSLDRGLQLETRWKISEREFLDRIFSHVDLRGTRFEAPPAGGPPR